jgi:hypothetical protein
MYGITRGRPGPKWKLFGSAIMMSLRDNNQSRIQRSADSQILQLAAAFAII